MPQATETRSWRPRLLLQSALVGVERKRVLRMSAAILALHLVGFGVFVVFVLPSHFEGFGIGVSVLAYTLGLRHAFDADHIAAIDNTIRRLLQQRQDATEPRPLRVGFLFSLGHSTVVIAMGFAIVVSEKLVFPALLNSNSGVHRFGSLAGTLASASFLFLIAILNIGVLSGVWRVIVTMRKGEYDEAELEAQLLNRGLINRLFGRWMRSITKEQQMYPVGVVFGLGFDTATEVALLATTALLASKALPWYSLVCLPILFTAGMTLMDTADGILMNVAYGWAFFNPVRKIFYNLCITSLSITICLFIGTVEILGLLPGELHLHGSFWAHMASFNLNSAGLAIVALFVLTFAGAILIWRYARIEERWSGGLTRGGSATRPPD